MDDLSIQSTTASEDETASPSEADVSDVTEITDVIEPDRHAPKAAVRSAPPPLPAEVPPPGKPAKRPRSHLLVLGFVAVNAAIAAAAVGLHLEVRRSHAPIAAISTEVRDLQAEQAGERAKLEKAQAQLDETRARLDEHAAKLAAAERRQKDADRETREHEAREAREVAALAARVGNGERRTYELEEAVKLIDFVQGHPSPPPRSTEDHAKP